MNKIILSADSTCDIGPELKEKYGVQFFNFHIQIGEKTYVDMLEITAEDIYAAWRQQGLLPKTAAVTPMDYRHFFQPWVEEGYSVIHINLGSGLSSSYQNCCLVAEEYKNVYPVDSANLSAGTGYLVVLAGEMIAAGMKAPDIQKELVAARENIEASFLLDTLEFMSAGGRCSAVTAFGANILHIKPCIEVDNKNGGSMVVGKKYRGSLEKVLTKYVEDKIGKRADLVLDHLFITHSGSPQEDIDMVYNSVLKLADFKEIHITKASGTISAHCGPRTLGVLFMTKKTER
ncbi:MAG: DegV family protein [Syntrophomonadaceae bacterium]|jgi:DegV family protein with EDD domain|nr:DegV family protein [Syntrophomonadaceae bacterium]